MNSIHQQAKMYGEPSMFNYLRNLINSMSLARRSVFMALPLLILLVYMIMPGTGSCQRNPGDPERGLAELRMLVANSSGKPSAEELGRIEAKYPRTRTASLARFLRGYLYYSAQNYSAAIDALDSRAVGANSSLGDYTLFYRAESELASGANSDALRDYGILYTKHPDSIMARDSKLKAASTALANGDPNSAIKEVSELAGADDADAIYVKAQALEFKGENDKALNLYRYLYYKLPATTARVKAETRLAALGADPKTNPGSFDEERGRADALFMARQYGDASQAYEDLLARFPDAERLEEVQLRYGISLVGSKKPAQAVLPLAKVNSRNADVQAESLYYQAEALRSSNRASESSAIVDRMLRQYPKSRRTEEALYNLASYYDKQDRETEASARYRQLVATYPKGEYAPEASYDLGWEAYQDRKYSEAASLLEQHLANYRYPDTKFIGEAAFWAGKSEERMGNKSRALALYDIAIERYRFGYHGYVAGLRASALRASDSRLKPEDAKKWPELEQIRRNALHVEKIQETADGSESDRVARADDLEMIGLNEQAVKELNKALERAPDSPRLNLRLAQNYSRRGDKFQATLVLRHGYPDIYSYDESELPREAWEIFFPMVGWETIKQEAKRYGIDPYMAAGLIRQESVFNPNAISRVGARGLMQLMPATGRLVAKRAGTGSISTADLYTPAINIKLGMNYLAQMLGQFGRIEYAAAAYNAGPGRAKRWIAERGSMDIEDWIESIPFRETRGYVQGVLRYSANYRRLYK